MKSGFIRLTRNYKRAFTRRTNNEAINHMRRATFKATESARCAKFTVSRYADRCVPGFFQGCKPRWQPTMQPMHYRRSPVHRIACDATRRVPLHRSTAACLRRTDSERGERNRDRERRRGERKRGVEWNSELTLRREITALSLPRPRLRYSVTVARLCNCRHHQRYRRAERKDAGDRWSLPIHQPINCTTRLLCLELKV